MDRHIAAAGSLWLAACAAQPHASTVQPSAAPSATTPAVPSAGNFKSTHGIGPVTVALVVDQFAGWVAQDRLAQLPISGGFARLRQQGTWYQDVRFAHAITETAPGHASLYSGKVPREHGIVANELWANGHSSAIVADDTTHIVTAEGERSAIGSSALAIKSEVVADRFKAQNFGAKVYSFSIKDRGAIFGGGRHPDLALWYDVKLGQFESSTAFVHRLPDWVLPAIEQEVTRPRIGQPWTLMDATWVSEHSITSDDQAGEGDFALYGTKFPHQPSHSSQPFAVFRANPESDRMLLELGLLAIDNSPKECPILIAISLSANDYIGHLFGPDSWEAWDELLRLDASLGWFFAEIDRRKGPDHWSAILSADHGIVPLPEVSRTVAKAFHDAGSLGARPRELTERVLPSALEKAARDAANKALGKGEWIAALVDPYLYLTDRAKGLAGDKLVTLRRAVSAAAAKIPGVERLFDTTVLPSNCPNAEDDSLDALVCRSVKPGRGGDYFIALKPGYFFDTGYTPGFGTSHGNAELADRSVPLLVRAPGQTQAGKIIETPQSFELFSRKLENLLGLK